MRARVEQAPWPPGAPTEDVLGYAVEARGVEACLADVASWIRCGTSCHWLACLNPHSYVVARRDARFSSALRSASWLIPDGAGIVLASRVLGGAIRSRITGHDVFLGVHRHLNDSGGGRIYLLGTTDETLSEIRRRMALDFPRLTVAGTHSPPFREEYTEAESASMVARINAAAPDVLWVGMTAPKQERWLHANHRQLDVRFAAGVGAVFDFYAGRIKRSHPAFQGLGLEWLPRLVQEPRRLWRRMLVSAPIFLAEVVRERLARGSRRRPGEGS